MTAEMIIFGTGAILIVIAIVGGGFEIKEIKLPQISTVSRIVASVAGISFIALGIWMQRAGSEQKPPNDLLSGHWFGTSIDNVFNVELVLQKDGNNYLCSVNVGQKIGTAKKPGEVSAEESCKILINGSNISIFSKVKDTDSDTGWSPDDFELQLKNGRLSGRLISERSTVDISFDRI